MDGVARLFAKGTELDRILDGVNAYQRETEKGLKDLEVHPVVRSIVFPLCDAGNLAKSVCFPLATYSSRPVAAVLHDFPSPRPLLHGTGQNRHALLSPVPPDTRRNELRAVAHVFQRARRRLAPVCPLFTAGPCGVGPGRRRRAATGVERDRWGRPAGGHRARTDRTGPAHAAGRPAGAGDGQLEARNRSHNDCEGAAVDRTGPFPWCKQEIKRAFAYSSLYYHASVTSYTQILEKIF